MATPSNITKRKKENAQLECTTPGEVKLSDPLGNVDPNAKWGAEPNFNLNFNLNSPSVSRSVTEAFKHQNKQDRDKDGGHPGVKGEGTMETTLMSPCEKQKSIVPTSSRSPTAQTTMDSHRSSPVIKQVSTLNSKMATSPKPNAVKLTSSTRTTERDRTATPLTVPTTEARTKSTNKMTVDLLMQSSKRDREEKICLEATPSQVLNPPTSPRVHNQEGDPSPISPVTNRTPGSVSNTQKTDPASTRTPTNQKPGQDSRAQDSEKSFSSPRGSQNQRTESDPLRTLHMTSVSPKPPSTQRATTRTRTRNTPGSKVHLHGKDSSIRSESKTRTKSSSSSRATRTPSDSLSSQTSTNSKTQTGSRETLDSKSSLDSKDGSDSKTDWSSKAGPNHKSRMGPRDLGLYSGITQTKAGKTHKDPETVFDSKSTNDQTFKIHQNTRVSPKPKTSPRVKTSSWLDVGSGSDLTSTSKIAVIRSTSKRNLKPPDLNVNFPRSASLSPISRERRKPTGPTARPGLDPKSPSDSFRSGPVRSSSQAALVDSTVAHSLLSVNQSPGSGPGKSLRVPAGPVREDQRSPGSPPGFLTSLASSSPETKTMEERAQDPASSVGPKRDPSCSSNITALTRGLTFDSITKTAVRPGNESEKEQLNLTEGQVGAAGGPDVSQQTLTDNDGGDTGRKPGTLLGKLDKLGNANVISSLRPMGAKEEKKKKQRVGLESTSSGLPPSTHTSTSKMVKETGTMTEWFERLRPWPGGQKDVGVQVEVGVVECSVSEISSLHQEPPASPLICSPSCQSSLSCIQPLKHICKINIELCEETDEPSQTTSLPARLRTFSFQQNPALTSELRQNDDMGVSSESNWEDENRDEKKMQHMKDEHDGYKVQTEKPQQVEWDEQGMTWEVYGASVDLDSLGKAIQSHLESKVRDQGNHIRTLRKSICSNSSFRGYMKKKKRRRRFLGCCMKGSTVVD